MRKWLCVQKLSLCLLFPPDSEVVERAWSPSQAAPRRGLLEGPSPASPRSSLCILFWLSSTWSCSSIDSIIQKNGLSPSYVPSIVLENENTACEESRYDLLVFTCSQAVVAGLHVGPRDPRLPVFTPLCSPLPHWTGLTYVGRTHARTHARREEQWRWPLR